MKTTNTLLLLSFLLLAFSSCGSYYKKQAIIEDTPLSIAIVPCEVVGLKDLPFNYSLSERTAIENAISNSIQSSVYHQLADLFYSEYQTKINLQPFAETNALLDIKGINTQESWELSTAELASILKVDAILRIAIRESPANMTRSSGTWDNPGAPKDDNGIWADNRELFTSANIFDGSTGLPLWTLTKSNLGNKHEVVARRLTKRIERTFP
jgi:hypothetical protein